MGTAKRNINKTKNNNRKISIIIPMAGSGYRMKSYGPKPLLELENNKTIFARQFTIIKNKIKLNHEIILVTGFESKKVYNNLPQTCITIENERFEETNVTRSIELGIKASTSDSILIIYGDLVFSSNIFKNFSWQKSKIFISSNTKYIDNNDVGCILNNKRIESMCWKLPNKWSQIVYLTGKEYKILKAIVPGKETWLGFEILNHLIDRTGPIEYFRHSSVCFDIDCIADLKKAKSIKW
jgi:NDP-sugar pyrophosphorylase family protein